MSRRPKRRSASATRLWTSASRETSQRTKAMRSPWPWPLATASVSAPFLSLRSATKTLAPSARKRMTVARPIPLAPPVTIATLSDNRCIAFRPPMPWCGCAGPRASLAFRRDARRLPDELPAVLRDFGAASVDARDRTHGLQQLPGAGEARRRAGLRPRMGGRAPLPRGIFALLGARAVPDGLRHGHQADPGRPWHRGVRAGVQSSRQDRRAHRHARPVVA